MNIFTDVKEAVSAKEVASFYGLRVNSRGFCLCPFHPDKHPSMKVDNNHYHCFGCGAHGDAVNLVAGLYGLSQYESAKKIICDLQLPIDISSRGKLKEHGPVVDRRKIEADFKRSIAVLVRNSLNVLHEYHRMLITWKRDLAPNSKDTDFSDCNPLFLEALEQMDKINWMMDELTFSDSNRQRTFLETYGEEIIKIEKRIKERQ